MKFLLLFLLLIEAFSVCAQEDNGEDDEDKKKPSWSTGLPERTSAPTLGKPDTKVEKQQIEFSQPQMDIEPTVDVSLPSEMNQEFEMPEIKIDNSISKPEEVEESNNEKISYEGGDVSNINQYNWEIIEQKPIKIPKTFYFSYKTVNVEISIDPQGKVVKVRRIDDLTANIIMSYAYRSIKKWRFKPPSEVGIEGIISKDFVIELESKTK